MSSHLHWYGAIYFLRNPLLPQDIIFLQWSISYRNRTRQIPSSKVLLCLPFYTPKVLLSSPFYTPNRIHELICVKNIFIQHPWKMTMEPSQWDYCVARAEPTTLSILKNTTQLNRRLSDMWNYVLSLLFGFNWRRFALHKLRPLRW